MSKLVYPEEVEKLQKFKRDLSWFRANYEEIEKQYKGQHVAIEDEEIIDSDSDYHKLLQRLRYKHHKDPSSFPIEYVNDRKFGYVL
jgi:hypothetical protein